MKYKVYFQKDTGLILSISNIDQALKNFFEVDYEDVEDFISGKKSTLSYKVVYNINTSSYKIIEKNSNAQSVVDDLIYKITPRDIYQVGVWKNHLTKSWSVSLSKEMKSKLEQVASRPNEILTFSITQHNNPNILHRFFTCSLYDLIDNDTVDFDFLSQDETDLSNFSVYTTRKFEKYTCGVIDA